VVKLARFSVESTVAITNRLRRAMSLAAAANNVNGGLKSMNGDPFV
jgi:hypothetical protein